MDWPNYQNQFISSDGYWEMGGPEGERTWRQNTPGGVPGQVMQDATGTSYMMSAATGQGDNWQPGYWQPIGTAMGTGTMQTTGQGDAQQNQWVPDNNAGLAAYQQQVSQGAENVYDFSGYNTNITGLPTLGANAFDNWQSDPFLNRMVNTAGKGAIYQGLGALLGGTQNLGAVTGVTGSFDPSQYSSTLSDATYKKLAQYMGVDTTSPDWKQQVLQNSSNYAMVKGMIGSEADPRLSSQILYKKGADGWNPILNKNWHERKQGSWWDEGGSMIMVPLSIVAGGLGAAAAGGGAAGAAGAGGITGTAGASGAAAYGAGALGSTLGTAGTASLGAGLAGAAGTGSALTAAGAAGAAGGLGGTLANAIGMGSEYAALPSWAQSGISGALQGAGQSALSGGNPLEGALTGGLGGAISPAIGGAVKDLGLNQTLSGALSGAASGGIRGLLGGSNPLTGALLGGVGGLASGGASQLGASSGASGMLGNLARQGTSTFLQNQIRDEIFQGRQDLMNGVYQEAAQRGISPQQLNQFMQTPQGRQAVQALIQQQGKGTLQSLFG